MNQMLLRGFVLGIFVLLGSGCVLGPDYARPEIDVPESFRGQDLAEERRDPNLPTVGDLAWFEAFDDPELQDLINAALQANYDLRIAAERVLQARANVVITNADRFPELSVGGQFQSTRATENAAVPLPSGINEEQELWNLFADLSWEIDFWGRFARASEAARADLLQTEFSRRIVIQSLVSELAFSYFDLLNLDEQLQITRETYESRKKSLELVRLRLEQGVANKVEYRQAEGLVLQSAGIVPSIELLIEQQENRIRELLGQNPGPVPRGRPLLEQKRSFPVPIGLPSKLLEQRPDVRAAEQSLIAANARIGAAKALLYPTIRLTALGGLASEELGDLIDGGSRIWDIAPSVVLPIFNAGRLRNNVAITESVQREAVLRYQQTLLGAFQEVASSLIALEKTEEIRNWTEQLEETLRDQVSLSRDRYRGGVTSYLEVLDSERNHYSAEIALADAIRNELFAYVQLYLALGGGWTQAETLSATGPQSGSPASAE